MREWLYGRNPVYEALKAGRRHIFRLIVARGVIEKGRLSDIIRISQDKNLPSEYVDRQRLDSISDGNQGVALEVSGYPYIDVEDILERSEELEEPPFILILDSLQDPQNLGTLLRTAEIVGIHGVILPHHRSAKVTPSVASSSSGASEHLLIARANLAQTIATFKKSNIWVIGLDTRESALPPDKIQFKGPIALVVGSESQGMRILVRDTCDMLMRLPMRGRIGSLNAAVAGSIVLYMIWQSRSENY